LLRSLQFHPSPRAKLRTSTDRFARLAVEPIRLRWGSWSAEQAINSLHLRQKETIMRFTTKSFADGGAISERYALGRPDPVHHVTHSENLNPELSWSDVPAGTRSLVVTLHDLDAPTSGERVNKEGVTVPFDLPRADFSHWILVDLDPASGSIVEGEFSRGVTAHGKTGPVGPRGTRQGLNDYTGWFKGDPSMEGLFFGYDGPCPPWNDERVHRYELILHAIDLPRCPVEGVFTLGDVRRAVQGHVLAAARLRCSYKIFTGAKDP
jgi:Raf kinase inhibitor-like YbhB/YbcL family protein